MAKILLVEDDEMIARMISLRLEMVGHKMQIAPNGQEGIDHVRSGAFDLVLMDMHMPVMDGHEAVRRLRDEGYTGIIIAVTASAMSSESRKAIESGSDEVRPELQGRADALDTGTLVEVQSVTDSRELQKQNDPAIVISASGMATGGRVVHHLRQALAQIGLEMA